MHPRTFCFYELFSLFPNYIKELTDCQVICYNGKELICCDHMQIIFLIITFSKANLQEQNSKKCNSLFCANFHFTNYIILRCNMQGKNN